MPPPAVPPAINGAAIVNATETVQALAPTRAPGSAGDQAVAAWVQQQFIASSGAQSSVTGGAARVGQQQFVARWRGRLIHGTNVYLSLPGTRHGRIATVGDRDRRAPGHPARRGGRRKRHGDARRSGAVVGQHHPSASADLRLVRCQHVGNAGMRWFLPKVHGVRTGAVINVDAPDESPRSGAVWVWAAGRDNSQALDLEQVARTAIARAGGSAAPAPGSGPIARLAVPQTFGDQAPAIAEGIPSVTVAGIPTPRSTGLRLPARPSRRSSGMPSSGSPGRSMS